MRAVLFGLPDVPRIKTGRPQQWQWDGKRWILLACGIGPVNAAWSLGRLLGGERRVQGVLNLGIAGSFAPQSHPLGSRVVVAEEIWPEFGLRTEQGVDPAGLGYAHGKVYGRLVWDRLALSPEQHAAKMGLQLPEDWDRVLSLSVSGATGCASEAKRLYRSYGADVENMEGFALAWGCFQARVPFLQVRGISNRVGSRRKEDWDVKAAFQALQQAWLRLLPGRRESIHF